MLEPRQGGFRRARRRTAEAADGLPTRAAARNAKITALPVAYAARRVGGLGRRALGTPAREVELDIQARTAQHMFEVLGELKGVAAKLGQLLALYELALPPELGEPYREALTRLQDSIPAMLPAAVDAAMAASLGPGWRDRFAEFDTRAAAAASVGQVHRAVWPDGRRVAVKLMYPGARAAVASDLEHLHRLAPLAKVFAPDLDTRAVTDAFAECIGAELDYADEAATQRIFASAFAGDPDFHIPAVVDQQGDVLVTEWLDGTPLQRVIASGDPAERTRVGLLVARFVMSSFAKTGLLYTDPHPGNFRVLPDGRLGVLDFGACSPFPAHFPDLVADIGEAALNGADADLEAALRRHEFVRPEREFDIAALVTMVAPIRDLYRRPDAHLTPAWLRSQVRRATDPSLSNVARHLTTRPEYAPIGRTILAATGVLCQLGVHGPLSAELTAPLPDLAAAVHRCRDREASAATVVALRPATDASTAATPVTTASSGPSTSRG
ncbi:AarF/ABC1/UbiB kinase family protein [Nocardia tengchongensis]|uniref:AarF/ABC1/UbiB kinase family protein n=1 Tax=Nocardia tengchongensis TaxID=2055889 RepID=A0ABX8CK03_9NOCA|nr:AarF/ABC1/UbiB kinase family protein [Nocardia tengchongensis]QVI19163.1 AarF/ABC1/UbiB kinase family protein [Nocardia tengchongensis]